MNAQPAPVANPFDVVAIVTSAGGLDAMSAVLADLPPDCPAAIVVGQHLGADSALTDILQRRIALPVAWVQDGDVLQPGRVHVCPPHMRMEVLPDRSCTLAPFARELLAEKPLDGLLASLADSCGARTLAVVLTGMGRDGAAGARAVRLAGGAVIVQSEASAAFAEMPRAAIDAGAADLVLPLAEIGKAVADVSTGGRFPQPRNEEEAREALFAGPGEARAALRAVDWGLTAAGPVRGWPPSLKAIVASMLHSRFPTCIFWGPEFIQVYNDAWVSVLGAAHPEAAGRPARASWNEIWTGQVSGFRSVLQTGEAQFAEDQMFEVHRQGFTEEAYFTVSHSPLHDERGIVQGVMTIASETTGRVLGARRQQALRSLAAAAAGADTVGTACSKAVGVLGEFARDLPFVLMYIVDAAGLRATLSAATGLRAGCAAAPHAIELLNANVVWPVGRVVRQAAPLQLEDLGTRLRGSHAGPWPEPPAAALLVPLHLADASVGGVMVAGLSPRLAPDASGREFIGLVAQQVGSNMAEARLRERERERIAQLAELDRARTEFFSNVSHEFRTPLTLILAPLEDLLAAGAGSADPLRRELELASRNARRLLNLVDTLLDFSQIEAGRMRVAFQPTDLAALTLDIASLFRSAVERAGLRFEVDCPPLPQPVDVDPAMWEKIVSNLLSNALKFTFEGTVSLRLRVAGHHAELTVADTGAGLAPEELSQVFRRFHRVRGARARTEEGAGIGLALVHDLVDLLHGRMRVRSRPGEGSTFTVWLNLLPARSPAAPPVAGERQARPVARQLAEEAARWSQPGQAQTVPCDVVESMLGAVNPALPVHVLGARILVADDNGDMRDYLARTLGGPWQVTAVADGAQALALAREHRPDLILADVAMPVLDGFGLLRELRADNELKATPLVLVTARAHQEAAIEGLLAGADDYIAKPFSSRELVARIGAQLELARVRRQGEREVRELLALMPVGVYACDAQGHFSYWNRQAVQLWGREPAPDDVHWALCGAARALLPSGEWLEPEDAPMTQVLRTGIAVEDRELAIVRADGARLELLVNIRPLEDGGRVVGAVCALVDVTARKHAERALQSLNEELEERVARRTAALQASEGRLAAELAGAQLLQSLGSRLISEQQPQALHEQMLVAAMRLVQADAASIQLLDVDDAVLVRVASLNLHPLSDAYWSRIDAGRVTPCGQALREGRRTLLEDVEAAPQLQGTRDLLEYRRSGIRSVQSTPLVTRAGRSIGLVSTHWREPGLASHLDYRLFDVLARQLADLLERAGAEAALRAGEEKYRALFNEMDEACAVVEVIADAAGRWSDFRFLDANPAFMRHTGMPHPVGRTATELLGTPNPRWAELYGRAVDTGESIRLEEGELTLGRVFDLNIFRLGGAGSRRVAVLFTDITDARRVQALLREEAAQRVGAGESRDNALLTGEGAKR